MEYARSTFGYIIGPGFIPQILLVVVILLILYSLFVLLETVVDAFQRYSRLTAVLGPYTYTSNLVIPQDPNDNRIPLIYPSENEKEGMEFSYSMYLFIHPDTFEGTLVDRCGTASSQNVTKLRQVFVKGSRKGFPLMAPGVFVHGDINTLRIYMNSTMAWDNYVDIPNVPVGKWFHLVITMKGRFLDVYINGNVIMRHEFVSVPKLNYSGVYALYSDSKNSYEGTDKKTGAPVTYEIDGAMKGMISRVKYYAFALNYNQIDALYREEPSKRIESPSFLQSPPYSGADWYVTRY